MFIGPNNFNFGTKTCCMVLTRRCQNLEQIDHNLDDHVFDNVICKPPIKKYFEMNSFDNGLHFVFFLDRM